MQASGGMAEDEEKAPWQNLGRVLREAREQAGLTQEQAAEAAGVSRVTLAKYEDGWVTKLEELQRIANAIGVDLDVGLKQVQDAALPIAMHVVEKDGQIAEAITAKIRADVDAERLVQEYETAVEQAERDGTGSDDQRVVAAKARLTKAIAHLAPLQAQTEQIGVRIRRMSGLLRQAHSERLAALMVHYVDEFRDTAQTALREGSVRAAKEELQTLVGAQDTIYLRGLVAALLDGLFSREAIASLLLVEDFRPADRSAALGWLVMQALERDWLAGLSTSADAHGNPREGKKT